ncbi:hypothetical protein AB4Z40_35395 [Bosea sp. 2YAB26]|uniref:hypothetical protein n=1 Tax=Bosea sp. 2YAB26 TaxID=3237478 RepID=UPI003F91D3C5
MRYRAKYLLISANGIERPASGQQATYAIIVRMMPATGARDLPKQGLAAEAAEQAVEA